MPRSLLTKTIRDVETMPRQRMKKLQPKRLRAGVARFAGDSPRIRRGEAGFDAHNIRSFDDLAQLPLPIRADLRTEYTHLASRFSARVRMEDNSSDALRLGESAFVLISDNAPHETGM